LLYWNKRLHFSEHHLSHAASAFYPSPFNEAAILTMDGVGEWTTTSLAIGYGRSFTASGSVEVFKSPSSGPTIEWADRRDLPIWSVMPFAKCSSAIAVLADQIRNRNARLRLPSGSTLFRFLRLLGHGARSARMFGVRLPMNFNSPLKATSIIASQCRK
jgi:hypothetical protein